MKPHSYSSNLKHLLLCIWFMQIQRSILRQSTVLSSTSWLQGVATLQPSFMKVGTGTQFDSPVHIHSSAGRCLWDSWGTVVFVQTSRLCFGMWSFQVPSKEMMTILDHAPNNCEDPTASASKERKANWVPSQMGRRSGSQESERSAGSARPLLFQRLRGTAV